MLIENTNEIKSEAIITLIVYRVLHDHLFSHNVNFHTCLVFIRKSEIERHGFNIVDVTGFRYADQTTLISDSIENEKNSHKSKHKINNTKKKAR